MHLAWEKVEGVEAMEMVLFEKIEVVEGVMGHRK